MTALKPYLAYKDSGFELLDHVPEHWDVLHLKRLTHLNPSKSEAAAYDEDESATFLPMEKVSSTGRIDTSISRPIRELRSGFTYFRDGDVIVAKITPCFENGKAALLHGLVSGIGFGSTEFHVLRPTTKIDARFLYRIVSSHDFRALGEESMEGAGGQKRVPTDFVANFPAPLPPLDEQRAIANFLDGMDARITRFIAARRKMIALLEEKKQAVINQAVTRGLGPSVPMKDSGVDWLGEIPAHWDVRRLTQIARLESGHTPSRSKPEYWEKCTIPWVSLKDVGKLRKDEMTYIEDTHEMISELGLANSSARLLPKDTVILSRTASVGYSAILGKPMATTQDYVNWICGPKLKPLFLLNCLRGMRGLFAELVRGSTHNTIYMPESLYAR